MFDPQQQDRPRISLSQLVKEFGAKAAERQAALQPELDRIAQVEQLSADDFNTFVT